MKAASSNWPNLVKALAPVAIGLPFLMQKDGGIWLVLVIPVFTIWALYSVVTLLRRPTERRTLIIRLVIWLAALVIAGATQVFWEKATRTRGDAIAAAILAHKYRAAVYPASLADIGLHEQDLKNEWRLGYALRSGMPVLSYPAALKPLTMYEYNFEAKAWKENSY